MIPAALTAAILGAGVQPALAASKSNPILYGTTGACNNDFVGGPCKQNSTLVQLDPSTGAPIRIIGPVGYTVNGLAWDRKTKKLYASTAIGCGVTDPTTGTLSVCPFHGLITINNQTGAGKPVDPTVQNFGLDGADSPIHSITINSQGLMVGWYDEFPTGTETVTDTFVTIDKATGIATEHPNSGIDTNANGLSFDGNDFLWNIDTARREDLGAPLTQTAYRLDPATGQHNLSIPLTPPTMAALGDFNLVNGLYYGLNFQAFNPAAPTFIEVIDLFARTVTPLGLTVPNLHTLAFAK